MKPIYFDKAAARMEAMMRSDESSESPVFRTVCGICTGTCGIALTLNLPERKILR